MLEELAAELVAVDSVNPTLVPNGGGEAATARVLAEWLERAGLEVTVEEVVPRRPNVIGVARGSGGGRTLILNGHLDTVGLLEPDGGLSARVESGRLYGRGAYDMKASLAAIASAGAECVRRGLRGDVIVAAVADEEAASSAPRRCSRAGVQTRRSSPSRPTSASASPTGAGSPSTSRHPGRAAHGSRPDLGIDAIAKMGRVLVAIEELDASLQSRPGHPLLGTGLGPCLADRGRSGVLELSGAVPAAGRAADDPRRAPRGRRGRAARAARRLGRHDRVSVRARADGGLAGGGDRPGRPGPDRVGRRCSGRRSGPTRHCSPRPASRRSSSAPAATARTPRSSGSTWRASSAAATSTSRLPPSSAASRSPPRAAPGRRRGRARRA